MIFNDMNILLYDNTQMVVKNGRYYCASGTGGFAQELVQLGNNVTMYGQQVTDPSSTSSFDIIAAGIKVAGLRRNKNKILSYLMLYINSIKFIAKSDFVYFFYPTSYRYLPFVCLLLGKKYGLYVRGGENVDNRLSRALYKHAYVVFTVAKFFTDMVNRASKRQVGHTIRPMISYTYKDVVTDRTYELKKDYSFLFLSRIQKEKGIAELLAAVRNLKANGVNNFTLTVVGGGPFLDDVKRLVQEYGIDDRVSIEGAVDDEDRKKKYYLDADIYILPTYYKEGFPRTLYEAMIFGTPILTTFVSGIPSLMVDMENCKELEPMSVKSIEEGIDFAIRFYDAMGSYAKNATQTVLKVVDPDRFSHAQDVDTVVRQINK